MKNESRKYDLILLFSAFFLLFTIGLGERPYVTPSEARYIEIPRQMLATSDFLTPHINGVRYFEKPPLFYWMQAFFLNFGSGEFFGRIATALVVTFICLITYATANLLYGRTAGLLASAALATSLMGYGLAHVAMLDAPVTLFLTATIAAFIFGQETKKTRFYYFMYVAAALAVMTKGLIGIVIPGAVIGGFIVFTGRWKILREARLISGTILFLLIAAPWHILVAQKHPEFFDFYFIHEHFTRFLTSEHKRTAPWWFFIAVTLVGMMPYTGVIPHLMRDLGRQARSVRVARDPRLRGDDGKFLLLWIILPLIFFSSSHSKLIPYIFPIFPPLFILIGRQLGQWWGGRKTPKILRINTVLPAFLAVAAIAVYNFMPKSPKLPMLPFLTLVPLVTVAVAMISAGLGKETSAKKLIVLLMLFGATLGLTANFVAGDFDKRTVKPLTEFLKPQLKEKDLVVAYNSYWQDLPVYLNRNVIIAGWQGELFFGAQHTPGVENILVSLEGFPEKCARTPAKVYVFINEGDFIGLPAFDNCKLKEINRYGKTILLTN